MRCVHCKCELKKETKDHVFPKSWYPETTPPNIQRWTVPSCSKCNNNSGKRERELFIRLALCIDPRKAEAAGLSAKAVRSMGVGADGLSVKERMHRQLLKAKIVASMWLYKPGTATFPGMGPHPGIPEEQQRAIPIHADLLKGVAEKIVRGCEYVLNNGRIVEPPYELSIYFVHEHNVPEFLVRALGGASARTEHLGPGFQVIRIAAHDEPDTVVYKVVVWGAWVTYASIMTTETPN